ncbi:hypothetical protein TSOC_006271 [Tetrabaena socialis]|uniref:Uncharacterized protein n=1 Tax=Tetrabaena socialis TaxID=47790 RepID=A0A2J8A456_9CHLO|nr:hypothetical protein TSOC_006271 [Tetrabaena socialis]|eukprot:PNH07288.1 hypothetical protein TSOC_006271 [Tetrabaena socialis]
MEGPAFSIPYCCSRMIHGASRRALPLMALEGGVHVHLLMLVCGDGDDGGSSGSVEALRQQVEVGFAAGGSLSPAVDFAVRRLLLGAPAGVDGGGSDAPSAFAWPPVVPLLSGTAEEGPGAVGRAHGAQLAQPGEVLLLLPTALLEGQTAVRCVVAGPASQPQQRQQVHLDAALAIAVASGGSAGNAAGAGYSAFRLMLPPTALQKAGALAVFVLQQSLGPSASALAPLAAFPLLALPAAAAAEVRQLYGEVLGPEVYGSLQQLLLEDTAGGGPGGWSLAASTSAAAASASAAIRQSGLTSLSHDIGALLQLPDSAAEEALEGGAGGAAGGEALAQQLPFHALPFADVLCFLASQRMGACLWEGLRALRHAGVQLAYAGLNVFGGSGGDGAAEAEALQLIRAVCEAGAASATDGDGQPPNEPGNTLLPCCPEPRTGASPPPPAGGSGAPPTPVKCSGINGRPGAAAGPSDQPTASTARDAVASSSHPPDRPLRQWTLPLRGTLRWWLHVLLLGFSPPGQERSYQAFKAARCWRTNLMAFGLVAVVRLATGLRTLRAVRAETAPVPAADGLGAGRLTELQQQLLAQVVFVAAGFLAAALAFGTPLLRRRRNALLLAYKTVMDPATFLLILWPPAWGGPLLRPPDAWFDAGRRYGMHWLYQSVLEPSLLQLPPRHQLWSALANLLPMTLLGLQVYRGRLALALRFGAGDAVLGLAMSCATDLATRRQFVRQRSGYSGKTE